MGQLPSGGASTIINQIKMSDEYLYAESTGEKWTEAYDNAEAILKLVVEDWIYDNRINDNQAVRNILEQTKIVRAKRGSLFRAFLYVAKPGLESDYCNNEQPSTTNLIEEKMKSVTSFYDIEAFIGDLKSSNLILDYGKYRTMPDGNLMIFIYNEAGHISAYLRRENNSIINLKNMESDAIENYKGCGAIWFRLRKI